MKRRLAADVGPSPAPIAEPTIAAVARAGGGHVPELDGIRALAIWGVLIEHLLFADPVTDAGRAFLPRFLAVPLGHMWLGVDLFFVLSGFLITGILLKTRNAGRGAFFKRFYTRRALRIWPLYFLVLGALCVAYGPHYATYFTLCVLFVANLTPHGLPVPDGAGPLWSLAVEEQFYLVWPWLVLAFSRRPLMVAAASIVILELGARCFARPDQLPLTWFRADGLAMGAFVAAWFAGWDNDPRSARRLALVLLAAAAGIAVVSAIVERLHLASLQSATISEAVCVFGALVVVAVAFSGHPLLGFLRTKASMWTALLSYSIYLVHRPIVDAFGVLYGAAPWFAHLSSSSQTIVRAVIVVTLAYALALLTRYTVELPFLRLGRERKAPVVA